MKKGVRREIVKIIEAPVPSVPTSNDFERRLEKLELWKESFAEGMQAKLLDLKSVINRKVDEAKFRIE